MDCGAGSAVERGRVARGFHQQSDVVRYRLGVWEKDERLRLLVQVNRRAVLGYADNLAQLAIDAKPVAERVAVAEHSAGKRLRYHHRQRRARAIPAVDAPPGHHARAISRK